MTPNSHLISPKIPGYGPSDGRYLPCSGISEAGPCSSRSYYKSLPKSKIVHLRCVSRGGVLAICKAISVSQKRNPDFSRKKQLYTRNRNSRQNEDGDDNENEEYEVSPSRNGSLLSSSSKHSTTESPGAKDKEILEIFKSVLEELQQRAATKVEKKVEESQVESKQTDNVDSLINLLRQHSAQQGKQSNYSGISSNINQNQRKDNGPIPKGKTKSSNGPMLKDKTKTSSGPTKWVKNLNKKLLDQPEQGSRPVPEDITFVGSNDTVELATEKSGGTSVKKSHTSNIWRRSPVIPVRYDPTDSDEGKKESFGSLTYPYINGKNNNKTVFEPKPKPEPEAELFLDDQGLVSKVLDGEVREKDEIGSHGVDDNEDGQIELSGMKVSELRGMAKSRGMKGFSKLKKKELVELLAGGSV